MSLMKITKKEPRDVDKVKGELSEIEDDFFDELWEEKFTQKIREANHCPLSDGEISDSDSEHVAIKKSIKLETCKKEPVEEDLGTKLQQIKTEAKEDNKLRKSKKRRRKNKIRLLCVDSKCQDLEFCVCRDSHKKKHKKNSLTSLEPDLPMPIIEMKTDFEMNLPASDLVSAATDASTFVDIPKIRLLKFEDLQATPPPPPPPSMAMIPMQRTKQMVVDQCKKCYFELTEIEMESAELQFIYTPTATVLEMDRELLEMRSPLKSIHNCRFNFSSIRNNVDPQEWGVKTLPNVVKIVASGIGLSAHRIEEAFKKKPKAKSLPNDENIEIQTTSKSKFLINAGVQTNAYACRQCLLRKVQKPVNTSTQVELLGCEAQTQTVSSIDLSYCDLPIMKLIPKMTPAAQLALNDFAQLLQTPVSGSGDMYKIREHLLDIYNRGCVGNMNMVIPQNIYQSTYPQLIQNPSYFSYPMNSNAAFPSAITNHPMYQQTIPPQMISPQLAPQQMMQSFTPAVRVPLLRENDPRLNRKKE